MRNRSHETFTGALRDAVEAWRKESCWSRETVVMKIVEAHSALGAEAATGIVFDPPTRDTFERAKVNADRVFRWLDDVTKDTNTCPPNFLPSLLSALPMDRRMALANAWLNPLEMAVRPIERQSEGLDDVDCFKRLTAKTAGALTSYADLLDGIAPGELEAAQTCLLDLQRMTQNALSRIEARIGGHS